VNAKSCGSTAGSVVFAIVSVPRFVFVNVQVTDSPASMANVAVRADGSPDDGPVDRPSSQPTAVTSQPVTAVSVKT
jgi:hypothetical protein